MKTSRRIFERILLVVLLAVFCVSAFMVGREIAIGHREEAFRELDALLEAPVPTAESLRCPGMGPPPKPIPLKRQTLQTVESCPGIRPLMQKIPTSAAGCPLRIPG